MNAPFSLRELQYSSFSKYFVRTAWVFIHPYVPAYISIYASLLLCENFVLVSIAAILSINFYIV